MEKIVSYEDTNTLLRKFYPQIKEFNPEVIVPINRGGLTLGHFLSKEFDLPVVSYAPKMGISYNRTVLGPYLRKRMLFVEDHIAEGRTLRTLRNFLWEVPHGEWRFIPMIIDPDYPKENLSNVIYTEESFVSKDIWWIFPWDPIGSSIRR